MTPVFIEVIDNTIYAIGAGILMYSIFYFCLILPHNRYIDKMKNIKENPLGGSPITASEPVSIKLSEEHP